MMTMLTCCLSVRDCAENFSGSLNRHPTDLTLVSTYQSYLLEVFGFRYSTFRGMSRGVNATCCQSGGEVQSSMTTMRMKDYTPVFVLIGIGVGS